MRTARGDDKAFLRRGACIKELRIARRVLDRLSRFIAPTPYRPTYYVPLTIQVVICYKVTCKTSVLMENPFPHYKACHVLARIDTVGAFSSGVVLCSSGKRFVSYSIYGCQEIPSRVCLRNKQDCNVLRQKLETLNPKP